MAKQTSSGRTINQDEIISTDVIGGKCEAHLTDGSTVTIKDGFENAQEARQFLNRWNQSSDGKVTAQKITQ